jgi:hypothetical protein
VPRTGPAEEIEAALRGWARAGPDILIDTTGAPAAIERAVRWAAPRAKILLFGVSDPEDRLCLDPSLIFSKELMITASAGMTPVSFKQAETLLRSGRLAREPWWARWLSWSRRRRSCKSQAGGRAGGGSCSEPTARRSRDVIKDRAAGLLLAVDIGGTKCAGLVSPQGQVILQQEEPTCQEARARDGSDRTAAGR